MTSVSTTMGRDVETVSFASDGVNLYGRLRHVGDQAPTVILLVAHKRLIDDPSWVSTFKHDPLIADARRLSVPTLRALLENWDGPKAVRQIHQPLLVIQGRNDLLQPPRESELVYEAANNPKQYRLVDTGHLPQLDAPAMLAGLLSEWLTQISGAPRPSASHSPSAPRSSRTPGTS